MPAANAQRSPTQSLGRLAGVDPREYLADVLPRLTGRIRLMDLPALMPARWAAQRAAAAQS
jgi:hypothetical protein